MQTIIQLANNIIGNGEAKLLNEQDLTEVKRLIFKYNMMIEKNLVYGQHIIENKLSRILSGYKDSKEQKNVFQIEKKDGL